jgi:YD repeat-containing protein
MARPTEIDAVIKAAARRRALVPAEITVKPAGSVRRAAPGAVAQPGTRHAQSLPGDSTASGTGINPWWRYQEQNVPGGGHLMVNVGTGNLLLQDDDMAVAHKGIAMAFRRTYNSQSAASVPHQFGSWTSLYGNGWTNTADAHFLSMSSTLKSIYDIDGARYDYYSPPGNPAGTPLTPLTPGQHATLVFDGSCGWLWTKKSGTSYYFYGGNPTLWCPWLGTVGGYAGRLYQIIGRNRNTYLTFSYTWDNGDASSTGKINTISATTESGLTATLSFADVAGHRLLQQILFPDGTTTVQYGYDGNGNLATVSQPPNNAAGTRPVQWYGYQTLGTGYVMSYATSPRWTGSDGGYVALAFAGSDVPSSTLSGLAHVGVMNPAVPDGVSSGGLQSGYTTGAMVYLYEWYQTGITTPTYRDSDGHYTNWVVDGSGRPTQTQECTATTGIWTCNGAVLATNQTWDANNNLTAIVDARGYETDYAYDSNGNAIAVAEPTVTTSAGTFRPTSLYSYDGFNNVTASCDPVATHGLGADWTGSQSGDSLCPATSVSVRMQWSAPSYEPFGELQSITTPGTNTAPGGYVKTITYDASRQGGVDYGLPTHVAGTSIAQPIDSVTPSRQPQQDLWYDTNGNVVCAGNGVGKWILAYDTLGRQTSAADPDDSAAGAGVCGKTGSQPNWSTAKTTSYFTDGAVAATQTASQRANGVSTQFAYDLDGDEVSETHHHGCQPGGSCTTGVTSKYYDGADRLVEVQLPYDGWDVQGYPWSTRYIYDLSQGGTTTYRGMALTGYGGLVATQEFLSGTIWQPSIGVVYAPSSGTWTDVRATAFDALDRAVSSYEAALGNVPKERNAYDATGEAGLLSSVTRATNEVVSYSYDSVGRRTMVGYQNDGGVTPTVQLTYDPAGRIATQTTGTLGSEILVYDGAGELLTLTEPTTLGGGTISYGYYPDGMRSTAGYSDAIQTFQSAMSYGYRADGFRDRLVLGNGSSFAWTATAAGRWQTQTDPLTGATVSPDLTYMRAKVETPYYPNTVTFAPWTQAYDNYGRLSAVTMPVNLFSYSYPVAQYDLEDGVAEQTTTAYVPPGSPYSGSATRCIASNIREEKISSRASTACANGVASPQEVNGTAPLLPVSGGWPVAQNWTLDARNGMLLHDSATTQNGTTIGSSYSYDASGRLVQDTEGRQESLLSGQSPTFSAGWCPQPLGTQYTCFTNGTRQKSYDAENRLHAESFTWANDAQRATTSYGYANYGSYWEDTSQTPARQPADIQAVDYGTTNHPLRFALYHKDGGTSESRAWLWDGDDRFLECSLVNSQCQSPSLSVEGLGDYDLVHGTIVRVNDRNRSGLVAMSHTPTYFTAWTDAVKANANQASLAPCSEMDNPYVCAPQHDGKLTADGWTLDYENWQGVRTFDPAVGQWNTPDAYAGTAHDPMSQKPYMWDRNNPYSYADPSGFDPGPPRLPPGVWRAPPGIKPMNANPYSQEMRDLLMSSVGITGVGMGAGAIVDRAAISLGGWVGAAVSVAYAVATDKGITPGYYAQTVTRDDGSATTYAVYKPPEGSSGAFVQVINFDNRGNWDAQTVFADDSSVKHQSGTGGIPRNIQ